MTISTVRPNGTALAQNFIRDGGGAADHSVVSDNSDATYAINNGSAGYLITDLGTVSLLGTQRIKQMRIRVRIRTVRSTPRFAGDEELLNVAYVMFRDGAIGKDTPSDIYSLDVAAPTTFSGAWRTTAPDGGAWTQAKLDTAQIKIYDLAVSPDPPFNSALTFYYETYADLDVNNKPVVAVSSPSGTQSSGGRVTAVWAFTDSDGDAQSRYWVKVFSAAQYGAAGFNPDTSTAVYSSGEQMGSSNNFAVPQDLANGAYRVYVKAAHDMPAGGPFWSSWAFSSVTIAIEFPPAPTIVEVLEASSGRVRLDLESFLNHLSKDAANLEGSIGAWASGGLSTVTRSTDRASRGTASLKIVSTGAGNALAITPTGSSGFLVQPGKTHRLKLRYYPLTTARTFQANIRWYDSTGAQISLVGGTSVPAGSQTVNAWNTYTSSWTAPANAVYGRFDLFFVASASGETYYVDELTFVVASVVNVISNPGFNVDTTGWTVATNGRRESEIAGQEGDGCFALGKSASGFREPLRYTDNIPVLPATVYTFSYYAKPLADASSMGWWMRVEAYDAANVLLGRLNSDGSWQSAEANGRCLLGKTNPGRWRREVFTSQATPANTSYLVLRFAEDSAATGDYGYIDAIQVERSSSVSRYRDSEGWNRGGFVDTNLTFAVEYSDNDWATVQTLRGTPVSPGTDQVVSIYDYGVNGRRQYRARAIGVDSGVSLVGDASPPSEANLVLSDWWLKDPSNPALNLPVAVKSNPQTQEETTAVFRPLGRARPIVLSDALLGFDGSLRIFTKSKAERDALQLLLEKQRALLLQHPSGESEYIRILKRSRDVVGAGGRNIQLDYVHVDAP